MKRQAEKSWWGGESEAGWVAAAVWREISRPFDTKAARGLGNGNPNPLVIARENGA